MSEIPGPYKVATRKALLNRCYDEHDLVGYVCIYNRPYPTFPLSPFLLKRYRHPMDSKSTQKAIEHQFGKGYSVMFFIGIKGAYIAFTKWKQYLSDKYQVPFYKVPTSVPLLSPEDVKWLVDKFNGKHILASHTVEELS